MKFETPRLELDDIVWLKNNIGPLESMAYNLIVGKGWKFEVNKFDTIEPDYNDQVAYLTIEDDELASLFILIRR